jgi:hypothetical protein
MSRKIDLSFVNHGTLFLAMPGTDEGHQWLLENCDAESYSWLGPNLAIEHRFAADIADGASADGLEVEWCGRRLFTRNENLRA